ncbi:hypothetical protein niasHT_004342 [Heterodera trifolii]|uniref:CCHC-type domain-containing protein n=1 Tax=Heterodera trifolii TaxID=157864 RepID=A0ABD2LT31_9BILA
MEFGAMVNARCERADMTLSKEEVKCLIFITGLSDAHKELRQECLRQMEKARKSTPPRSMTLEALLEECRSIQSLQNSAAALSGPGQVHSVQVRPQRVSDGSKKSNRGKMVNQKGNVSVPNSKEYNFPFNSNRTDEDQQQKCKRCGQFHVNDCPYAEDVNCYRCGKRGHIRPVCPERTQSNAVTVASTFCVTQKCHDWIWTHPLINGHPVKLAADTCSHLTIIQESLWISLGSPKLRSQGVEFKLKCSVANTGAPNIMGLDWIVPIEKATQSPIATTLDLSSAPTKVNTIDERPCHFKIGDTVRVLNYGKTGKSNWFEGKIVAGKGLIWKVKIPLLNITVNRHKRRFRMIQLTKFRNNKILATALSRLLRRPISQFNQRNVLRDNTVRRYVIRRDDNII